MAPRKASKVPLSCDLTTHVERLDDLPISTALTEVHRGKLRDKKKTVTVAIKRLRFPDIANEDNVAKHRIDVTNTILQLRTAKHANIAQYFGTYTWESDICIVSFWGDNGSLAVFLEAHPDTSRLPLLIQIAAGIEYLHTKLKVVHGNLHAGNVLIDGKGVARICDFGLNKCLPDRQAASVAVGPDALPRGKFVYVAPELHQPGVTLSTSSDVFSFGVLGWAMFSGSPPFLERGAVAAMVALSRGDRPSKDGLNHKDLTEAVWQVISKCWAHDVAARPDISAVRKDLTKASKSPRKSAEKNTRTRSKTVGQKSRAASKQVILTPNAPAEPKASVLEVPIQSKPSLAPQSSSAPPLGSTAEPQPSTTTETRTEEAGIGERNNPKQTPRKSSPLRSIFAIISRIFKRLHR